MCVFLVVAGCGLPDRSSRPWTTSPTASRRCPRAAPRWRSFSKDLSIAIRFGYRREEWAELVRLLVGIPAGRRRAGRHGLLARVLLGDDVADLLSDTALVDVVRQMAPIPDMREGR